MSQGRLNIAVFIDFDNIEIGVKSTLGERFDVGSVLEAVKERGEVVTKVAYGDWTRAGDYSRSMTQHAVRMVQRNLTPGGDKNGADINLALDALEMAFTHDHINAFVIVGGDSDFITLVEKLKQYDKTVFIVGGRGFTSMILQKNCHEFVAYENIIGTGGPSRRPVERGRPAAVETALVQAFPLVRRALKVLADREVSAQLGLLKSTLLQLDSSFSEREYGASTFRDFVHRLERAGFVSVRGSDRSLIVELRDTDGQGTTAAPTGSTPAPESSVSVPEPVEAGPREPEPTSDPSLWGQGVRHMHALFLAATVPVRWPMYLRNLRQFLKAADETFDERRWGFRGIIDAVRAGHREGLFRVERDRRGILRVFPGALLQRSAGELVGGVPPPAGMGGDGAGLDSIEETQPLIGELVTAEAAGDLDVPGVELGSDASAGPANRPGAAPDDLAVTVAAAEPTPPGSDEGGVSDGSPVEPAAAKAPTRRRRATTARKPAAPRSTTRRPRSTAGRG